MDRYHDVDVEMGATAEPRTAARCLPCKVPDLKHQPSKNSLDKTANRRGALAHTWWGGATVAIRNLGTVHGPWSWLFDHHGRMRRTLPRAF